MELRERLQKHQETKKIIEFKNTTSCDYCKKSLQLPLVHLNSGQVYHARCLKQVHDGSSSSHDKIIRALRRKGKNYNSFLECSDCDDEDERYNKMMGYFGVVGVGLV
jgi:hypothetical protein